MHALNQTGGAARSTIRPVLTAGCGMLGEETPRDGSTVPCNFYLQNTDFYLVLGITSKLPGNRHVLQPCDTVGKRRMCTE